MRERTSRVGLSVKLLMALAMMASSGLFAAALDGTWQGIVSPPENQEHLRTVLKIAGADGATIKATFYSPDQTYLAFPATLTLKGDVVKLSIPGIGANYDARLSKDGETMVGTIKAGVFPTPVSWTLKRVKPEEAWALREPPTPPKPLMNPDPSFEVATVKPSPPDSTRAGMDMKGDLFSVMNLSLLNLMTFAYDTNRHQIAGAPAWFTTERFDITGKPEGEGTPSQDQMRVMLRKLLAERFQLAVRRDKQEMPVYTINVSKSGSKFSRTEKTGDTPFIVMPRPGTLAMSNASMADLCRVYQSLLDRPCVDQTGLAGRYEFSLVWTPDRPGVPAPNPTGLAATPDNANLAPDIFLATQEQLGLKIEAGKSRIEVLVIDKVERPTGN